MSPPANSSRAPFILVSVVLLTLALAFSSLLAARNFLADVYAEPAKDFLQFNRDEGYELTEAEWQVINVNLQRALKLDAKNPVTLTELGRLHRIQLEIDTLEPEETERHGTEALAYYERAATLRPTWPWGWSNMALVRYELFQDSQDAFHQALINAARFGPWEASIQRLIVELGLDTWDKLSPAARQAVLVTADRALKRQPAGLNAIVDAEVGWPILCNAVTGAAQTGITRLAAYCTSLDTIDEES